MTQEETNMAKKPTKPESQGAPVPETATPVAERVAPIVETTAPVVETSTPAKPKTGGTPPKPAKAPALRIAAKTPGFRRAGRAWHGVTDVPVSELSPAQVAALRNEPMLTVEDVEIEA